MNKEITKLLYISAGFMAALLIMLSGFSVYKYAHPDKAFAAQSTYTETWTATQVIGNGAKYSGAGCTSGSSSTTVIYNIQSNSSLNTCDAGNNTAIVVSSSTTPQSLVVSVWSVSGTVTLP